MAVISSTRNGMIGKCGKPFCGDCCAWFRQGSGKAWKRRGKHQEKRKEDRRVQSEVDQELAAMEDEAEEMYWSGRPIAGCTPLEPCGNRNGGLWWCLPCALDAEFRSGDMDEFA